MNTFNKLEALHDYNNNSNNRSYYINAIINVHITYIFTLLESV